MDVHYLGKFNSISEAWKMFPNGGGFGDYITVNGVRYDWSEYTNTWGEPHPGTLPTPPPAVVDGDLDVNGHGSFRSISTGDYIPGVSGAAIDEHGNGDFRTVNIDSLFIKDASGKHVSLSEYIKLFKTELPPVWDEYTKTPLFDDIRLLVFDKNTKEKFYTTIGDLKQLISGSIGAGGGSGGQASIQVLRSDDHESIATDNNVFASLRTLAEIKSRALSKVSIDTAQEVISFSKGIIAKGTSTFESLTVNKKLTVKTPAILEKGFQTGKYGVDVDGLAKLKHLTLHDGFQSPVFFPGISGEGVRLNKIEGTQNQFVLEIQDLIVNGRLQVNEVVVRQWTHIGAGYILSHAGFNIDRVEELPDRYRVYKKESEFNTFQVGSQALCQRFESETLNGKRYWRLVIAVAADKSYIDLSKSEMEAGSDAPEAGDGIFAYGYRGTDNSLKGAIVLSSIGEAGPYFQSLKGIDSFDVSGKTNIFIGNETHFRVNSFEISSGDGNYYRVPVDRGKWAPGATASYYDRFSHNGSLWLCIAQPSTTLEPAEGSPAWLKQVEKGTDGKKGDKGDPGTQGVPGTKGADGQTTYTWIRYADTATGTGISNNPTGKLYIGFAYNKTAATESNTPSDYTWSLIKGENGVPGAKGEDGITYYTWVKYSDNADGTGLYDVPTANTKYIGIAINQTTSTESTVKTDYTWSKFRGDDGVSITNVDVEFAVNSTPATAPTTGWITTAPTLTGTQQLWTRTKTTYSTGNPTYTTAANITPKTGETGTGIDSIVEEYYLSTSKTTQTGGAWVTTPPAWENGKYIWTRIKITYKTPTSIAYTAPQVSSEWEAINGLEIGGRNLLAKKYIREWNNISGGITTVYNEPDGYHLRVLQASVYGSIGGGAAFNDIFQGKIKYKENTQYALKVRWRLEAAMDYSGLLLRFKYSDGGVSNWIACDKGQVTIVEASLISAPNKTVAAISTSYGTGTYRTMLYDIQLTEGNKQTAGYMVAPEDIEDALVAITASIAAGTEGKMLYKDPTFKTGTNSTARYNNAGGSTTIWSRIAKSADCPTDSGYMMRYSYLGGGSISPGYGGFTFSTPTRANAILVAKIIAKIPVGRNITFASNPWGDADTRRQEWLTPVAGTGKFEAYICKVTCGATGTFSTTNYFYILSGADGAFDVDVAYATVFDLTLYDDAYDKKIVEYDAKFLVTDKQIKANASAITSTQGDVSGLTTRVSDAEGDLKMQADEINLRVTKTDYNDNNTAINKSIAAVNVRAGNIELSVSNIQVGGRNLVLGSGVAVSNNNYPTKSYNISPEEGGKLSSGYGYLVPGKQYTISLDVTPAAGVANIQAYVSSGWAMLVELAITGSTRQTLKKTFTMPQYYAGRTPQDAVANAIVHLYRFPNNGTVTGTTTIHSIKIEHGNKPTAWTEAPEDLPAQLLATGINIESKKITLTADNTIFQNNAGQQIALFNANWTKIQASAIELEGLVTVNGKFKVLLDGSIETTNMKAINGEFSGKLTATSGTIGAWTISGGKLAAAFGSDAGISLTESGGRFIEIQTKDVNSSILGIRSDSSTALSIYTDGKTGKALHILAQTDAMAIASYGSHYFYQRSGETWSAPGLLAAGSFHFDNRIVTGFNYYWRINGITLSVQKISNNEVQINHNLGHMEYTPLVWREGGTAYVYGGRPPTSTYFAVDGIQSGSGAICFLIIGRNKYV